MKISIVTVSYNSVDTIRQTIESVLNQCHADIEYIVIDGGSTDGTVNIIKEYSDKITYWCSEKDDGIYDAMNKGIRRSTGEVIAFMNSDDWYYNNNIFKNIIPCFERLNAEIVYGDFIQIWENEDKDYKYFSVADKDPNMLYFTLPFCHQAMFMRRSLFDMLGEYNLDYKVAADYEWVLKAYINNITFQYIPECICCFRRGGYSQNNQILSINEYKMIQLSMLPEKYYDRILQEYENKLENSKIYTVQTSILLGDQQVINIMQDYFKQYDDKLILWGAGIRGKRMKRLLDTIGVRTIEFMDNDQNKWGLTINGIKVEKPHFVSDENIKVFITIKENYDEVKEQLIDLGYKTINIIVGMELFKEIYEKLYG